MEAMVPTVPGLVSEIEVPWKSGSVSLPVRARATRSSSGDVLREGERAGVLDVRDQKTAGAVLPATSTARPKLISFLRTRKSSPAGLGEYVIQGGISLHRFHDCPADDVGVGELALAQQGAVVVDQAAVSSVMTG